MMSNKRTMLAAGALCALLALAKVSAQSESSSSGAREGAVDITQLISEVAKKSGKTFLLDPRVRAEVVLPAHLRNSLDYASLLTVLDVYGFVAVEENKLVRVVPGANARQLVVPVIGDNETYPSAQYVTRLITVRTIPAAQLVPILRPLLPQQAHFVASPCTNTLLIADTFGNVKRLEKLIQALDKGSEPYKPKCMEMAQVAPQPPQSPQAPKGA